MTARKQRYIKKALATALAAAGLGLAALPAQADLEWRVTDVNLGFTFTIADNSALDSNLAPEQITVNTMLLNALLAGAGSKFQFTSAGANDNIATATTISSINSTFEVQAASGAQDTLIVEASRDGWFVPVGNPRTLSNAPSTTMTFTTGTETLTGFNDGGNLLFGTQFATPNSSFTAGVAPCSAISSGGLSSCADNKQTGGIVESNPYSLTNKVSVLSPATDGTLAAATDYQITDASTKFATPTIPEPASLLLLGAGLAALGFARRRTNG
jgi:hypothetical protein